MSEASAEAPEIRRVVGGQYRLNGAVHRTAPGVVCEATSLASGKAVSVTFLHAPPSPTLQVAMRRVASRVRPSFPAFIGDGVEPDGTAYFVSERVMGEPLAGVLSRDGPFEVGVATRLLLELCNDLEDDPAELQLPGNGLPLYRALEPDCLFLHRDPSGAPRIHVSWLGWVVEELRGASGEIEGETEPQALVKLLALLVGQAAIVSSAVLALIVERALSPDRSLQYVDRRELMTALLPLTRFSSGRAPKPKLPDPAVRFDEDVQISVFRPRSIVSDRWYRLLAFVHLATARAGQANALDPVAEVARRARAALGENAASYASTRQEALAGLPEGGLITLLPEVDGVDFNPRARSFAWREDVHEESFQLRARASPPGTVLRGTLSAYLGTVLLAEVSLKFALAESEPAAAQAPVLEHGQSYRKIFASYSHDDARVVSDFATVVSAFGDRYLVDVKDLRSGEMWSDGIEQLIKQADIFQLFWSTSSMKSEYCRREWEFALQQNKPIRPVFWELPMPRDEIRGLPPPALAALQFARLGAGALPANDTINADAVKPPSVSGGRWRGLAFAVPALTLAVLASSAFWVAGTQPTLGGRSGDGGIPVADGSGTVPVPSPPDKGISRPTVGHPVATALPGRPQAIPPAQKLCFIQGTSGRPPYEQVNRPITDSPACEAQSIAAYRPTDLPPDQRQLAESNECSRVILYDCGDGAAPPSGGGQRAVKPLLKVRTRPPVDVGF